MQGANGPMSPIDSIMRRWAEMNRERTTFIFKPRAPLPLRYPKRMAIIGPAYNNSNNGEVVPLFGSLGIRFNIKKDRIIKVTVTDYIFNDSSIFRGCIRLVSKPDVYISLVVSKDTVILSSIFNKRVYKEFKTSYSDNYLPRKSKLKLLQRNYARLKSK